MTGYTERTDESYSISVNPFFVFFTIFLMPYFLFFLLMMFITGLMDPILIVNVIIKKSSLDFIKVWVIGSFVLSVIGTIYISGINVKVYVKEKFSRPKISGGTIHKEGQGQEKRSLNRHQNRKAGII